MNYPMTSTICMFSVSHSLLLQSMMKSQICTVPTYSTYTVHPESFRSNARIAIAFARRNRPRVDRNDEFACVYLRSRAFAFVREYCSRSTACAYMRAYVRI